MRTKYLLSITVLFTFQALFVACDKVDDPFPVNAAGSIISLDQNTKYIPDQEFQIEDSTDLANFLNNYSWDSIAGTDNSNERYVVLEEFTGHTCKFCPDGTREIIRLDDIFEEQLIPVAIHAGSFAAVFPPSYGKYTTDFRVDGGHGNTYLTTFGISSYPSGIVSRVNNAQVYSDAQWEAQISNIVNSSPIAQLMITNFYNVSERIVRIQIDIEWLSSASDEFNLQLYLAEDHIIDWQLDGNTDVPNYDHRHVLRKVVNGTWGKSIGQAVQGETISIQYITRVDADWKANDMESIAFIYKNDGYEVMQANAAYIYKP